MEGIMKKFVCLMVMILMLGVASGALADANREIRFDADQYVVYLGTQQKIVAQVDNLTEDAPKKTVLVWSSSDESVAKVSSNGSVTGVAAGNAIIQAVAKDDESIVQSVQVEVRTPVKNVTMEMKKLSLLIGASPENACAQLTAIIEPMDAYHQDVTWTSSNEKVAVVDECGIVTALARGNATITATSKDPSVTRKSTCQVTVTQAVTEITMDQETVNLPVGKNVSVKAKVGPSDAGIKQLIWSSSDESIARVTGNGAVQGVAAGQATITATAKDGSGVTAQCIVTVVTPVRKVTLDSKNVVLAVGTTWKVSAAAEPEDATIRDLVWTSSNEKVATVDENGTIKGVGKGNATISAMAVDGSKVKGTVSVRVQEFVLVFLDQKSQNVQYYYGSGRSHITGAVKTGNVSIPDINTLMFALIAGGPACEDVPVTPMHPGTDVVTIKVNGRSYTYTAFVSEEAFQHNASK